MRKKHKNKPNCTRYVRAAVVGILLLTTIFSILHTPAARDWFYHPSASSMSEPGHLTAETTGRMTVYFLNVGQGDCTLVTCGDAAVLIDSGEAQYTSDVLSRIQGLGITSLNLVIVSHFHSDHAGGMAALLQLIPADEIICPSEWADTLSWRSVMAAAEEYCIPVTSVSGIPAADCRDANVIADICGQNALIRRYGNLQIELLFPGIRPEDAATADSDEENNASLAVRFTDGNFVFLACGDAESEAEEAMLLSGADLSADVWKASHHGSAGSGEAAFLTAVMPSLTVISCGKNNSYGLPAEAFLTRLADAGIAFLRTDEQGDIAVAAEESGTVQGVPVSIPTAEPDYVLNRNTMRYHLPDCDSVPDIAQHNRIDWSGSAEWLQERGFRPCRKCLPE